jgi:hypothetical protein
MQDKLGPSIIGFRKMQSSILRIILRRIFVFGHEPQSRVITHEANSSFKQQQTGNYHQPTASPKTVALSPQPQNSPNSNRIPDSKIIYIEDECPASTFRQTFFPLWL